MYFLQNSSPALMNAWHSTVPLPSAVKLLRSIREAQVLLPCDPKPGLLVCPTGSQSLPCSLRESPGPSGNLTAPGGKPQKTELPWVKIGAVFPAGQSD